MQLNVQYPAPQPFPLQTVSGLVNDQDLLLRAAAGEAAAFEELFRRHRVGLRGFLLKKLRSPEEAEDAVALTFCKAWRAREGFRGNASGKAWLYQIATRVALDMLRRRPQGLAELDALEPEALEIVDEEVLDPETMVLDRERCAETRTAVHLALAQLPPSERQLVRLFYFDGHNYDQISSLLGVSRSQVRGRLHRIRRRIHRDMVERLRWQPA